MAGILELSDQKFKTTITNILKNLMEQLDNMQEQTDNVSRGMAILRKNQKELLVIKITITEMKNGFDGLISRLDTAEGRL